MKIPHQETTAIINKIERSVTRLQNGWIIEGHAVTFLKEVSKLTAKNASFLHLLDAYEQDDSDNQYQQDGSKYFHLAKLLYLVFEELQIDTAQDRDNDNWFEELLAERVVAAAIFAIEHERRNSLGYLIGMTDLFFENWTVEQIDTLLDLFQQINEKPLADVGKGSITHRVVDKPIIEQLVKTRARLELQQQRDANMRQLIKSINALSVFANKVTTHQLVDVRHRVDEALKLMKNNLGIDLSTEEKREINRSAQALSKEDVQEARVRALEILYSQIFAKIKNQATQAVDQLGIYLEHGLFDSLSQKQVEALAINLLTLENFISQNGWPTTGEDSLVEGSAFTKVFDRLSFVIGNMELKKTEIKDTEMPD